MSNETQLARRSRGLVLFLDGGAIVGQDFMSHCSGPLSPVAFTILAQLDQWTSIADLSARIGSLHGAAVVTAELAHLLELGFVVLWGTDRAVVDATYESGWLWGASAGLYHFGIKYTSYLGPEESVQAMRQRILESDPVPVYQTNDMLGHVIELPALTEGSIFLTMRQRRSHRGFDPETQIPLQALADCLFAGLGIVGFAQTEMGSLPLKMTPSAGARNPYEAYICAYNVEGLPPAVYHYSAVDNTMGRVSGVLPPADAIIAQQPWFRGAAALILLIANFQRTMWKYRHPTGFRVVLIEAGHIAQNMLLAATASGLAAAPTSAIDDHAAEQACNLDPVMQAAVYSVAIGFRAPTPSVADVSVVSPNTRLRE